MFVASSDDYIPLEEALAIKAGYDPNHGIKFVVNLIKDLGSKGGLGAFDGVAQRLAELRSSSNSMSPKNSPRGAAAAEVGVGQGGPGIRY